MQDPDRRRLEQLIDWKPGHGEITPVRGKGVELLREHGGVAALLRY